MHIASAEIVGQKQKDFFKEYLSVQGSMVLSWQLEAAPWDETAEVDHFGPRSEQALLKPQEGSAEEPTAPEDSLQGDAASQGDAAEPLALVDKGRASPLSTVTTAMDVEQDLTLDNVALSVPQTIGQVVGQLPWHRVLQMLKETDNNFKQFLEQFDNFIFPGWDFFTGTYPDVQRFGASTKLFPAKLRKLATQVMTDLTTATVGIISSSA